MALALLRAPAPPVPTHPVDWTPSLLQKVLAGLNPRRRADREQAQRFQRVLAIVMRQEHRDRTKSFELSTVLEAPRKTLPIQVLVYREFYEYLDLWLTVE